MLIEIYSWKWVLRNESQKETKCVDEQLIKFMNLIKYMAENEFEEKTSFMKLEQNGT